VVPKPEGQRGGAREPLGIGQGLSSGLQAVDRAAATARQQALARQQAIADQLAKPLTTEEVQQVRSTREERIEQEKLRFAAEQHANRRKFFRDHTAVGGAALFTAFLVLAAAGGIIGIVTQDTARALLAVVALTPLLYLLGFRKAFGFVGLLPVAVVSAGVVFLLMRYIPSLHYASSATSHLPFVGDRTVILGRQIFTSLLIFPVAFALGAAILLVDSFLTYGDLFDFFFDDHPLLGWIVALVLPAVIFNLLIVFNWGFGLTDDLGFNVLGVLIGYVPGFLGGIGAVLGIATIIAALREGSLVEREADSVVQRDEWRQRSAARATELHATMAAQANAAAAAQARMAAAHVAAMRPPTPRRPPAR
jgi:hypothetical protein